MSSTATGNTSTPSVGSSACELTSSLPVWNTISSNKAVSPCVDAKLLFVEIVSVLSADTSSSHVTIDCVVCRLCTCKFRVSSLNPSKHGTASFCSSEFDTVSSGSSKSGPVSSSAGSSDVDVDSKLTRLASHRLASRRSAATESSDELATLTVSKPCSNSSVTSEDGSSSLRAARIASVSLINALKSGKKTASQSFSGEKS